MIRVIIDISRYVLAALILVYSLQSFLVFRKRTGSALFFARSFLCAFLCFLFGFARLLVARCVLADGLHGGGAGDPIHFDRRGSRFCADGRGSTGQRDEDGCESHGENGCFHSVFCVVLWVQSYGG